MEEGWVGSDGSHGLVTDAGGDGPRRLGFVYSVLVSNRISGVQSAGATLRVLIPQRIESLEKLDGGGFRLRFGDHDGHALQEADKDNFTVQWSGNLAE